MIAAIIAIITAIGALLAKVISLMKSGNQKVKENVVKASEKIKNTNNSKPNNKKVDDDLSDEELFNQQLKKSTELHKKHMEEKSAKSQSKSNTTNTNNSKKEKEYKIHKDVIEAVKKKDLRSLKYIFQDCLDVDPTFKSYKADFDYVVKNGMMEPHKELTPFLNDRNKWNVDYYDQLKMDLFKNMSVERISHMCDVAYYATHTEKVKRLNKERGEDNDNRTKIDIDDTSKYQKFDIKKHRDDVVKQVSDDFKLGKIDTQAGWFKKLEKYIKRDLDKLKNDKFHGLSMYDFSKVIKEECIENCIILLRATSGERDIDDTEIVRAGINPEYIKNTEKYGLKQGKISQSYTLQRYVSGEYNMFFNGSESITKSNDPAKDLSDFYNKTSDDSVEFLALNFKKFLDSDINKNAEKIQKKLNSDIRKFEEILKRVKENDFGASEFNNKDELRREKVGKENIEEWRKNVLYIEQNSVKFFQKFVQNWQELEMFRLKYVNGFVNSFTKNFTSNIEIEIGYQ